MVDLVGGEAVQVDTFRFSLPFHVVHPVLEGGPYALVHVEPGIDLSRRVIHSYEETGFFSPILEPEMVRAVVLDHFPVVFLALPHGSLSEGLSLFLCLSDSPEYELIPQGVHAEGYGMFF